MGLSEVLTARRWIKIVRKIQKYRNALLDDKYYIACQIVKLPKRFREIEIRRNRVEFNKGDEFNERRSR